MTSTKNWFCLDTFAPKVASDISEITTLTRDVTGQHYCPVLSDVSLPKLSEMRLLKFRLVRHRWVIVKDSQVAVLRSAKQTNIWKIQQNQK